LFRRKPAAERNRRASQEGNEMNARNDIDLEIALRTFHELARRTGTWDMPIGIKSGSYSNERLACKRKSTRSAKSWNSCAPRDRKGIETDAWFCS
jgi:hypothetical protein